MAQFIPILHLENFFKLIITIIIKSEILFCNVEILSKQNLNFFVMNNVAKNVRNIIFHQIFLHENYKLVTFGIRLSFRKTKDALTTSFLLRLEITAIRNL